MRVQTLSDRVFVHQVQMFHTLGYLTDNLVQTFPGHTRAAHSIELLEPLVEHSIRSGIAGKKSSSLQEHRQVIRRVRDIFGIAAKGPLLANEAEHEIIKPEL